MRLPTLRPHSRQLRRLDAYLDGSIDSAGRNAFERHLQTCEVCTVRVAELSAIRSALRSLREPVPPRSFRLTAAMTAALADPAPATVRQRVAPAWVRNTSRGVGALAAAGLAVLLVVDIVPRSASDGDSTGGARLAASAGEAAAGQAPETADSATMPAGAPAPKATEAPPTFDGGQVTAQAAGGDPGSLSSPEPPATGADATAPADDASDDQSQAPGSVTEHFSADSLAVREAGPPQSDDDNWLLRASQLALAAVAIIGIGASFLIPGSRRKAQS